MELEHLKGLEYSFEIIVDNSITASAVGSGGVDVLSTPSMILLFEQSSRNAVQPSLPKGYTTVGIKVDIEHLSATPVGEKVRVNARVTKVDGRQIFYEVNAFDEHGIIGKGTHTRFTVNLKRFMEKIGQRNNNQIGK